MYCQGSTLRSPSSLAQARNFINTFFNLKATTLHQNKSGVAAEIAEKDKREHYTKYVAYNPEAIIPFAAERTGALGEQAVDLLTTLAKKKYPPVIAVDENGQEKAILSRQCSSRGTDSSSGFLLRSNLQITLCSQRR